VKFAFIDAEKAQHAVRTLCRVLEVSRSGFYAWKQREAPPRSRADALLSVEIATVHRRSRRTYGSPRVHAELRARGRQVGRKRVARLMRQQGLQARRKRRFRATTDSKHQFPVAENSLGRQFEVIAPNLVWVADITYVWTREGWLYLAVVLDLFARRVVGWATSDRIDRRLTLAALEEALRTRRPVGGVLHHSDRGSQYASDDYRDALAAHGMACSMSRKGDCWDNAVAESFFATLKAELVADADHLTRAEAQRSIAEYIINFYNTERRHSHNGYLSPLEYELMAKAAAIAA